MSLMSFLLKISYQNKHKKYRYHSQKPVNFNQIKNQLSIHLPDKQIRYQVQQQNKDMMFNKTLPTESSITCSESELIKYLQTLRLSNNQMIKIRVVTLKENEGKEQSVLNKSQIYDMDVPTKLEKIRSKSQQIDIGKQISEETSAVVEITQQFICNSQLTNFKSNKNKELEDVQQQLAKNRRKLKLLQDRRRNTNVKEVFSYWNQVKKGVNNNKVEQDD